MKEELNSLQKIMRGLNYQTTFGIEIFEDCKDFANFIIRLKNKYPESKPEPITISSINESTFWTEINYAFDYRGDHTAGLKLNESKTKTLQAAQDEYKRFIKFHLDKHTKLYSYNGEGIPGYPVYWEYYLIIECQDKFIFIYGSSSD